LTELEADLVVVGFGGAGAAAAIAAADLGGSAIIVEKQAPSAHTPSTRMSGGIVFGVNDVAAAARYLDRCAGGMIPFEVTQAWAEKAAKLVEWLEEIGADLQVRRIGGAEHPRFDGAEAIDVYQQGRLRDGTPLEPPATGETAKAASGWTTMERTNPDFRTGDEYFQALAGCVARRPRIQVLWESPARRLLTGEGGRVTGVEVDTRSGPQRVRARRGVVLAAGGYEFDERMKLDYLKAYPIHFYGNPGNTGDGVRLAQGVGADLWHMNQMVGRAIGHFELDSRPLNFNLGIDPPGYVITDRLGRRYANEYPQAQQKHNFYYEMLAFDADRDEYSRIPSYWFFDEHRMRARTLTPVGVGAVRMGMYAWSPDNEREVELGWIKRGHSFEEVAAAAGVEDPDQAALTLREYNRACAAGADPLGRPAASLAPLDRPPFYCVPVYPGGSNTCGGPRKNEHAQALDPEGLPIPGLYAAGELGEAVGLLYPADGSNLSESICFGRIAAEHALTTRPEN
jgi:succinate dehydrogenase/fumarate reductase flavoprotein subunit